MAQDSDPQLALFLQKGDIWHMPNCSQATCEGNNVVSLSPRQCPEVKAPSCANGYPPLKVDDQDGCCQHFQCQCEWGIVFNKGSRDRGGENEVDTRKEFPLSGQGWACQVEITESQSHRAQWEKRRVLCVSESQQLMKDLSVKSKGTIHMCHKGTAVSRVPDLEAVGEGLDQLDESQFIR